LTSEQSSSAGFSADALACASDYTSHVSTNVRYFAASSSQVAADAACDHDVWGHMHMPNDLARTHALSQDLEYFLGPDWEVSEFYTRDSEP